MTEKVRNNWQIWAIAFTVATTLCTLFFYGGMLYNRISTHEVIDDERVQAIKLRITTIETTLGAVVEIRSDLRAMLAKQEQLQKDLLVVAIVISDHIKSTATK